MKIGIYPGSFDPVTNGHLDIIRRANKICDKIIVAIGINSAKRSLFTIEERIEMLRESCYCNDIEVQRIELTAFEGLLADLCKKKGVDFIIRGIRSVVDFDYEYPICLMNRRLAPDVETIFIMSDSEYYFISSSIVREVASYGGEISSLVPPFVNKKLTEKFPR
ncbi:MAG: pantetheine-phosphate adenylyltransferase [Spirochaetota bacterium]|nr:pantetheine-phosphate adenylyltransferase [Spirochaetota bacterium]